MASCLRLAVWAAAVGWGLSTMDALSHSQLGGCRAPCAPPAMPAGARPAPGSPGSGRPQHGLPGCPQREPREEESCAGPVTVLEFRAAGPLPG